MIIVTPLLLFAACGRDTEQSSEQNAPSRYQSYFERKEDYDAFFNQAVQPTIIDVPVRGIIAPHHLVVGNQLASLYSALSDQRPSVVVIIGPDHSGVGVSHVTTTDIGYDTPYGPLHADERLVERLMAVPFIELDQDAFIYEHSINSHTAFIRRMFGDVPILPIMIHGTTTMDEAEAVAAKLHAILPADALVIASVDFSHYVPQWVADFHDEVSASTVDAFDLHSLAKLEVDSPVSLATLQMYLTMREARKIVYRDHTNSASATNAPETIETTSHVYRAFTDGEKEDAESGIGMLFYGDSMFDRGVEAIAKNRGQEYILNGIAHREDRFFIGPHLSILNLESPITDAPAVPHAPVILRSDEALARSILGRMNIDVLSFNNNHTYDAGEQGASDTLSFGRRNDMAVLHPDEPCRRFSFSGKTVALCAFDDSRRAIDTESAARMIQDEKQNADWVVISIHWGEEYRTAQSDRQRSIAQKIIDAGADAIVGHGPHVVQPIEFYKEKPIIYSLGNFLFDQFDDVTNVGLIMGLYLQPDSITLFPIPFRNIDGALELFPYNEQKEYLKRIFPADRPR